MAKLIDNTNIVDGRINVIRTGFWKGELFTPSADAWPTDLEFYMWVQGSPGDLRVSLYGVDGSNHPTGSALETILVPSTAFGGSFAWVTGYAFAGTTRLTGSTTYALMFECDGGDASNQYWYYEDNTPGNLFGVTTYNNGTSFTLDNYEPTVVLSAYDYRFSPPSGRATKKRLIAAAASTLYYEDI